MPIAERKTLPIAEDHSRSRSGEARPSRNTSYKHPRENENRAPLDSSSAPRDRRRPVPVAGPEDAELTKRCRTSESSGEPRDRTGLLPLAGPRDAQIHSSPQQSESQNETLEYPEHVEIAVPHNEASTIDYRSALQDSMTSLPSYEGHEQISLHVRFQQGEMSCQSHSSPPLVRHQQVRLTTNGQEFARTRQIMFRELPQQQQPHQLPQPQRLYPVAKNSQSVGNGKSGSPPSHPHQPQIVTSTVPLSEVIANASQHVTVATLTRLPQPKISAADQLHDGSAATLTRLQQSPISAADLGIVARVPVATTTLPPQPQLSAADVSTLTRPQPHHVCSRDGTLTRHQQPQTIGTLASP